MESISVLMATYNGEKFIVKQLDSIIKNMSNNDELIIVDDGSSDNTFSILTSYASNDPRIKVYLGGFHCQQKAIEYGLQYVNNDIIFYSDQDDIWTNDKKIRCLEYFKNNPDIMLIQHNAITIDENGKEISASINKEKNIKKGFLRNLIKGRYFGCCMVMKKKLIKYAMPIPKNVYFDYWIGLIADKKKAFLLTDDCLTMYRRHSTNQTTFRRRGLFVVLKSRLKLLFIILKNLKKFGKEKIV